MNWRCNISERKADFFQFLPVPKYHHCLGGTSLLADRYREGAHSGAGAHVGIGVKSLLECERGRRIMSLSTRPPVREHVCPGPGSFALGWAGWLKVRGRQLVHGGATRAHDAVAATPLRVGTVRRRDQPRRVHGAAAGVRRHHVSGHVGRQRYVCVA